VLLAYNKTDRASVLPRDASTVAISAVTGLNLDLLRQRIVEQLETLGVAVPVYGAPETTSA
jgi:50S ribosomal subunit-associated GTPase HflX